MKLKKILSFMLVLILTVCMATPVLAADEDARRQAAIEAIKEKYPDAVINIGEDGSINVFVPNRPVASPSSITSDRFKAEEGGTFTGFFPPSVILSPEVPIFISFAPGNVANLFRDMLAEPDIFYMIVDTYISYGNNIDAGLASIQAALGYAIPAAVYTLIGVSATITVFNWLDLASLDLAMSNGTCDAIQITRTSLEGIQTNYYFGWTGDYVSPWPYEDWNPTWNSEDWSYLFAYNI